MTRLLSAVSLVGLLGGCFSLPPEIAAEMRAPDDAQPNNYALRERTEEAGRESESR